PLIAVVFLLVALVGSSSVSTATTAAAPSPSSLFRVHTLQETLTIAAPYHLESANPTDEQQIIDSFAGSGSGGYGTPIVSEINSGYSLVAYAIIEDASVQPGQEGITLVGVEQGLSSNGATRKHTQIAGRQVIYGNLGGSGYAVDRR